MASSNHLVDPELLPLGLQPHSDGPIRSLSLTLRVQLPIPATGCDESLMMPNTVDLPDSEVKCSALELYLHLPNSASQEEGTNIYNRLYQCSPNIPFFHPMGELYNAALLNSGIAPRLVLATEIWEELKCEMCVALEQKP